MAASSPSRMDILVLSSLARMPMHGYEIKLELRYKHVRWWAKCEHGHLYAALTRLEKKGFIQHKPGETDGRGKKIYEITGAGKAHLEDALVSLGSAEDATYFDIDLFLSGSFLLGQERVLEVLEQRRQVLQSQLAEARQLEARTAGTIPAIAHLIISHRVEHLERENAFVVKALELVQAQGRWGSYLQGSRIQEFLDHTGAALERD